MKVRDRRYFVDDIVRPVSETRRNQMEYAVGEVVEVVANPQFVERLGAADQWVTTRVEPVPAGHSAIRGDGTVQVFVRLNGMLVNRQLKYVRKGQQ